MLKFILSDHLNDGCAVQGASQRLPLTSHKASSACNMQSIQHLSGKLYESIVDVLVVQASVELLAGGMQESQRPVVRSLLVHSVEISLGCHIPAHQIVWTSVHQSMTASIWQYMVEVLSTFKCLKHFF